MHAAGYIDTDRRYWQHSGFSQSFVGGALGVEYFFVLSGAVILLAHRGDIGRPDTISSYLGSASPGLPDLLDPPHCCSARILMAPLGWGSLPAEPVGYHLRVSALSYSFDGCEHARRVDAFHEILFYLLFVTCLFRRSLGIIVFSAWGLCSLAACILRLPPYLEDYLFSPLHLLFILGMVDTWLLLNRSVRHALSLGLLGVAVLTSTYVWVCLRTPLTTAQELLAGFGAALAVLGFAALEKQNRLNVPRPLQLLGDASYSIYLVHYPFLMALAPITYKVWTHARGPVTVPFLVMAVSPSERGFWSTFGLSARCSVDREQDQGELR